MVDREERRTSILLAAIDVFSKNGFYKAKIQEIAERAGVGKGTIYEYFESKKHLFEEMIKYMMEFHKENITRIIEENISAREKLLAFFNYHTKVLHSYGDVLQSMANQSEVLSEDMRLWLLKLKIGLYSLIGVVIEEGIARGELREDLDVEIATCCIIGTINQYSLKKIYHEKIDFNEVNLEAVIDVLMKGFKK